MTGQTIVTVDGWRGRYSLHGRNPDGSVDVYGPVVEDHDRPGRWIGSSAKGDRARTRPVNPDRIHCDNGRLW